MTSFKPLDKENWPDLQDLFGKNGACEGCWCMYWRLQNKEYQAGKGEKNRQNLHELVEAGNPLGVLAYKGDKAVGWCSVAPRAEHIRLDNSRLFRTEKSRGKWSIACLFVHKDHRRQGLSVQLIRAACDYAFSQGAETVEAYPYVNRDKQMAPAFAYVGFSSSFEKAGFEEVKQVSDSRKILRKVKGKR